MGGDLLDRPDQAGDLVATGVEAGVDQVAASSEGLEAEAVVALELALGSQGFTPSDDEVASPRANVDASSLGDASKQREQPSRVVGLRQRRAKGGSSCDGVRLPAGAATRPDDRRRSTRRGGLPPGSTPR